MAKVELGSRMEKIYVIKYHGIQSGLGYKNYKDAFRGIANLAKNLEEIGPKGYDNLIHAGIKNTWIGKKTKKQYEISWIMVI